MTKIVLNVKGMTCGGCVKSIKNALAAREGISATEADLEKATVSVEFDPAKIEEAAIRNTIVAAGFDVAA